MSTGPKLSETGHWGIGLNSRIKFSKRRGVSLLRYGEEKRIISYKEW